MKMIGFVKIFAMSFIVTFGNGNVVCKNGLCGPDYTIGNYNACSEICRDQNGNPEGTCKLVGEDPACAPGNKCFTCSTGTGTGAGTGDFMGGFSDK